MNFYIDLRCYWMFFDLDFYFFSKINVGRLFFVIWKILFNVFEIEFCKFIVKLWIFFEILLEICFMCSNYFINVFEYIFIVCLGMFVF